MHERRRSARTYVFKAAQLIAPDRHKVIGCTVRDLSDGGACLDIADGKATSQFLDLSFDWFRSVRRCEVRWCSAGRIGVAFR
jgi:PilZ domain-containing protein